MVRNVVLTWLLTCMAGSLLLFLCFGLAPSGLGSDASELALIAVIAGVVSLLASIPGMLGYGALAHSLRQRLPAAAVKGYCSLYAIGATIVSFMVFAAAIGDGGGLNFFHTGLLLFAAPYALSFAAAIWLLPLPAIPEDDDPAYAKAGSDVWNSDIKLPAFPQRPFYMITGIILLSLLYSISRSLLGGAFHLHATFHMLLLVISAGLTIGGLTAFIRREPVGWGLLMLISCAGISGAAFSIISSMGSGLIWLQMPRYFIPFLILLALDITAVVLLNRPDLRRHFGISAKARYGWILAGVVYALVSTAASSLAYQMY